MSSFAAHATASTDERDAKLVIREVVPGVVTFSVPFTRGGLVPIGGRSTALRLASGDVFVYASHPVTPATRAALNDLGGEVKYLVTPDAEHDMNIDQWVEAYPNAQAIGLKKFESAKPHIKWAGLFGAGGENKKYGFEPEVTLHEVSAHINHELVAIHHPTGTLLEADLVFNLPPTEQYSRAGGLPTVFKFLGSGSSMSPGGLAHKGALYGIIRDKALAKQQLAPLFAAQWDRLIPCHGDIIETGGKAAFDKVYGDFRQ
ncbi:hypothetical protein Q5752_005987 [Cryptotrichosporon argae]